ADRRRRAATAAARTGRPLPRLGPDARRASPALVPFHGPRASVRRRTPSARPALGAAHAGRRDRRRARRIRAAACDLPLPAEVAVRYAFLLVATLAVLALAGCGGGATKVEIQPAAVYS